jgi:hypothetical protein
VARDRGEGAVAAAVGHALLAGASDDVLGGIQAFAAGTILTMIAAVMLPAAYGDGREAVGLSFVLGFALLAFLTSQGGYGNGGPGRPAVTRPGRRARDWAGLGCGLGAP